MTASLRRAARTVASGLVLMTVCAMPGAAQSLPAAPNPVPVALAGSSTALLVLDVTERICTPQPKCIAFVPRVATLLANARRANAFVLYSGAEPQGLVTPVAQPPFLPAIAPVRGDPIVIGVGQDRFFGTALDEMLRKRGIKTLILAGWRENGSVLYTAVGATLRGFTVVVADDATSAAQDYDVAVGRYQLLTQLNANPTNAPLKEAAVTLSRTDLITFRL
jgi:nicotinamidase-related amidase